MLLILLISPWKLFQRKQKMLQSMKPLLCFLWEDIWPITASILPCILDSTLEIKEKIYPLSILFFQPLKLCEDLQSWKSLNDKWNTIKIFQLVLKSTSLLTFLLLGGFLILSIMASVLQCFLPSRSKNICLVDLLALNKLSANAVKDHNRIEITYLHSFPPFFFYFFCSKMIFFFPLSCGFTCSQYESSWYILFCWNTTDVILLLLLCKIKFHENQ